MKAQGFSLQDQNGLEHSILDYRGKWLVLYFYPEDDTPSCTKEACSFRDNFLEFKRRGIAVVGISKDTVRKHKRFEKKYDLNFTLLSDPELKTIKAYGAWGKKKFMGREFDGVFRDTYLINPDGEIVRKYDRVKPKNHVSQIMADIEMII